MSTPLRLGERTQSPYSPGLPPGLTRKEKLLYAAEKLLIHPPSLLLRPLPLHPDLTSSRRARTSPRRLCAPVWSLKRLVRLRADTSASPKRHWGFACRRGRKTTTKIRPCSFIHIFIRWTDHLWSDGLRALQTGIFIRHAARRSCSACASKSFLPRHKV